MKSLNPACKLIGLAVPTLLPAGLHRPAVNLTALTVCLAALPLLCANVKVPAGALLPILLVTVGMFPASYHFYVGADMPINTATQALTGAAMWDGLVPGSRMLAFAGLGLLLILTADRILLVRSLQRQLHLLPVSAYGLPAAWGVLPNTMEEYKRTRVAFTARGIRVFPVSPTLLKPLLAKSIYQSEELSIATESRGFDGRVPRTCNQPLCLQPADVLLPILSCALSLALFFLLGR